MKEARPLSSDIIRNFNPSWFSVVMGTGVLAMTGMQYSVSLSLLATFSYLLMYVNIGIFLVLLIPWTLRWIMYRHNAMQDLRHPMRSNFYPTMTIAIVVLSIHFKHLGMLDVAYYFWLIGSFGTILFSVVIPYEMFKSEEVHLDHITPAWFIPPVALIVIPLGGPFIEGRSGIEQELVILMNYFAFGAGFLLYISLLAICLYRFILHRPLPNVLAPTIWIGLGPIGAGAVALVNMINGSAFVTLKEPFFVLAFLLWGFGIWWLFLALGLTTHYIRRLNLPYSMGWWAFIFPLGAYVAGSHTIALVLGFTLVDLIGFALYWLLFALWLMTIVHGVRSFVGRESTDNSVGQSTATQTESTEVTPGE